MKLEMTELKLTLENMDTHLQSLMKKLQDHSEGQQVKETTKIVFAEKSVEEVTVVGEVNNEQQWMFCPDCNYKCETENNLNKHINTKHNTGQFCAICSKKFLSTEALESHKVSVHKTGSRKSTRKGIRVNKCDLCSYNHKNTDDLKYHMIIEHRYEACDECGKIFSNMELLHEHFEETKHKVSMHDDNRDVSLDKERLDRLQKDMEAADAAGQSKD